MAAFILINARGQVVALFSLVTVLSVDFYFGYLSLQCPPQMNSLPPFGDPPSSRAFLKHFAEVPRASGESIMKVPRQKGRAVLPADYLKYTSENYFTSQTHK